MTDTYQPVPVTAFGCRFRSTTEARWAAFFNSMRLPFEYEAETFDLGAGLGWYVPDFWLPTLYGPGGIQGWWIEIKPGKPSVQFREWSRAAAVARLTEHPVAIATGFGKPLEGPMGAWAPGALFWAKGEPPPVSVDASLGFWSCICGVAGLTSRGHWWPDHGCPRPQWWDYSIRDAYDAGRSFRAGER